MNPLLSSIDNCSSTVKGVKHYRINKDSCIEQPSKESESYLIVERYNVDAIVKHKPVYKTIGAKGIKTGKRGKINAFSDNSCKRLKFQLRNTVHLFDGMVALTYPADFPYDGKIVKRDLDVMRKRVARRGMAALWVLEFQGRGAPHMHVLVKGKVNKQWLSRAWYEIVGSGDEKHLRAGTTYQHIVDDGDGAGLFNIYISHRSNVVLKSCEVFTD